jgi:HEPN domain-containing protein
MDEAKRELVQQWLLKALHDLIAARSLTQQEPVVLDVASYHCQQAAEKAVKAFLVFRDQDPERTHDVDQLLEQAARLEPAFAANRTAGKRLTPYATLYRYPSAVMEPNLEQLVRALDDAASIYDQVLSFLPTEVHPETTGPASH